MVTSTAITKYSGMRAQLNAAGIPARSKYGVDSAYLVIEWGTQPRLRPQKTRAGDESKAGMRSAMSKPRFS